MYTLCTKKSNLTRIFCLPPATHAQSSGQRCTPAVCAPPGAPAPAACTPAPRARGLLRQLCAPSQDYLRVVAVELMRELGALLRGEARRGRQQAPLDGAVCKALATAEVPPYGHGLHQWLLRLGSSGAGSSGESARATGRRAARRRPRRDRHLGFQVRQRLVVEVPGAAVGEAAPPAAGGRRGGGGGGGVVHRHCHELRVVGLRYGHQLRGSAVQSEAAGSARSRVSGLETGYAAWTVSYRNCHHQLASAS